MWNQERACSSCRWVICSAGGFKRGKREKGWAMGREEKQYKGRKGKVLSINTNCTLSGSSKKQRGLLFAGKDSSRETVIGGLCSKTNVKTGGQSRVSRTSCKLDVAFQAEIKCRPLFCHWKKFSPRGITY